MSSTLTDTGEQTSEFAPTRQPMVEEILEAVARGDWPNDGCPEATYRLQVNHTFTLSRTRQNSSIISRRSG